MLLRMRPAYVAATAGTRRGDGAQPDIAEHISHAFKFQTARRYAFAFSRLDAPEVCINLTLLRERAQGKADADCTRGRAHEGRTSGPQVQPDRSGFPRANGLRPNKRHRILWASGFSCLCRSNLHAPTQPAKVSLAWFVMLGPPLHSILLLEGQEHGQTIPLPDIESDQLLTSFVTIFHSLPGSKVLGFTY
jgi:hypothetical protein